MPSCGLPFSSTKRNDQDEALRSMLRPRDSKAVCSAFLVRLPGGLLPDQIVVLAVAHSKKKPGYWQQRVEP